MRIVALEEHFTVPALIGRIAPETITARGFPQDPPTSKFQTDLRDLGATRLEAMDEAGITLQVMSTAGPGADLLAPEPGTQMARDYNDALAAIVAQHPDRYAGFAHLPMTAPEAAADELERAVKDHRFAGAMINGMTEGRFLDDPRFEPILSRAEDLDVPLYLHPNVPLPAIREAYYDGLPGQTGVVLSMNGWGWHQEVAIHTLRLVLSGTLDRHPRLKLIIGHMGEGLPMMLSRCDYSFAPVAKHLTRTISQTILDQVWITTSGFFSLPPFMAALLSFGADRILFSVDYPFSPNSRGRTFLDQLSVSPEDKAKIAHGNADRLLKL